MTKDQFAVEFEDARPYLTAIAYGWTRSRPDAEDLVQDTALFLLEGDRYTQHDEAAGRSVRSWSVGALRFMLRRYNENFRTRGLRYRTPGGKMHPEFDPQVDLPYHNVELLEAERRIDIHATVGSLEPWEQERLRPLLDGSAETLGEAARLLGIPRTRFYMWVKLKLRPLFRDLYGLD